MKKYLIVLALVFLPLVSKADTQVFGFMNGSFYDANGNALAICFLNQTCLKADNTVVSLADFLGLSTSTPSTITITSGLPTSTPVSQPVVIPSQPSQPVGDSVPVDTTPPQLLQVQYWQGVNGDQIAGYSGCGSANSCSTYYQVQSELQVDQSRYDASTVGSSPKYISIGTDKPTTATFTFTSATGTPLTYTDSNLDTVHNINYADVPLQPTTDYKVGITIVDASGNQSSYSYPQLNFTIRFEGSNGQ